MNESYKILGVSENATNEEIEKAYNELKAKYMQDRFLEGEAGNVAAKNLTKLEAAYSDIKEERTFSSGSDNSAYKEVSNLIKDGKFDSAQDKLDAFSERDAEWHYLQSVIFYKKNWTNESKKQLEIALDMDPNNVKYKNSYEKLKAKMDFAERQFHSGNANYSTGDTKDKQMGGDACGNMADCCTTWCCLEILCNGCGR